MRDIIFAVFCIFVAAIWACCFVAAIKGHELSIFLCAFIIAIYTADKVWASRHESILYRFLKGSVKND